MQWRYIPFQYYNPYVKTGLNQVSTQSVEQTGQPMFWLAGWKPSCVNIGRGQNVEDEVNLDYVEKRDDIVVVRRQGGGGATYLTTDGEATWNLAAPEHLFPGTVQDIYSIVCSRVIDALGSMGIKAWHEPVNDVVTENGKISGATVKKQNGVVYAAGTVLYDVDVEDMFTVLTPGNEKLRDKDITTVEERVTSITSHCAASFTETVEKVSAAFLQDRQYEEDTWSNEEKQRAERLAARYRSPQWIHGGELPGGETRQ